MVWRTLAGVLKKKGAGENIAFQSGLCKTTCRKNTKLKFAYLKMITAPWQKSFPLWHRHLSTQILKSGHSIISWHHPHLVCSLTLLFLLICNFLLLVLSHLLLCLQPIVNPILSCFPSSFLPHHQNHELLFSASSSFFQNASVTDDLGKYWDAAPPNSHVSRNWHLSYMPVFAPGTQ